MHVLLRRTALTLALVGGLIGSWSVPAGAQPGSTYTFQITPYLWTTGVNGTIVEQGRTANVDASFGDVIRHLDMAAMFYLDARFGRWRASYDNFYANVSDERATPGPLFDSVKVASKLWIANPEAGYAVLNKENRELAVTGGIRVWTVDNKLTLFRQGLQADFGSGSRSIVDPVVGLNFSSDLSPKIFVVAKADIGGFNAAAKTDWQAFGAAGYKLKEKIVASIGYRYLAVDYKPSSSVFDISMRGVIVGIGFRF